MKWNSRHWRSLQGPNAYRNGHAFPVRQDVISIIATSILKVTSEAEAEATPSFTIITFQNFSAPGFTEVSKLTLPVERFPNELSKNKIPRTTGAACGLESMEGNVVV